MAGFMKTYDDETYALMRIIFGLMFVVPKRGEVVRLLGRLVTTELVYI